MVSNNSLAPALQQRLQRALIAFAENRPVAARRELAAPAPERAAAPGHYRLARTDPVTISTNGAAMTVARHGVHYPAYSFGSAIRYIPGLDAYVSGNPDGSLYWLGLYEQFTAVPVDR